MKNQMFGEPVRLCDKLKKVKNFSTFGGETTAFRDPEFKYHSDLQHKGLFSTIASAKKRRRNSCKSDGSVCARMALHAD